MKRPAPDEYAEYYQTYIGRVPDRPVVEVLAEAPDALTGLLSGLTPEEEAFAYAPGKWSVREVVGHVIDTERLFSYRAAHVARADPAALPGMDQDVWVAGSNAPVRPIADQLAEFAGLRAANVSLFASLDEDLLSRTGVASGFEFTARALVYIVAGHELHHRDVLESRYLKPIEEARG